MRCAVQSTLSIAIVAALLLLGSVTTGAAAAPSIVPVQWPGSPDGPPGPPGVPPGMPVAPGAPPGWPGPGAGPAGIAHQQYCERMAWRLERIRHRVRWSPPWERDRLGFEAARIDARLRRECWGQ